MGGEEMRREERQTATGGNSFFFFFFNKATQEVLKYSQDTVGRVGCGVSWSCFKLGTTREEMVTSINTVPAFEFYFYCVP